MARTRFDEKPNKKLLVLINGYMVAMGKTAYDIADMLDCSPATAYRRLYKPGTLTVDELGKLCRGLHIPIDELRQAITLQ